MKIKILYHGSIRKIKGKYLIPKQPHDLEKKKENLVKAVYASHIKDIAIAMAIISCKGVLSASLNTERKRKGIIYEGWPKQKNVYLYFLPVNSFKRSSKESAQWFSTIPIEPLGIKKLEVKKYLNLVRKATKRELNHFFKRYGKTKVK